MFNDAIPDAWAISNRGDPICTLPVSRDPGIAVGLWHALVLPVGCLQLQMSDDSVHVHPSRLLDLLCPRRSWGSSASASA